MKREFLKISTLESVFKKLHFHRICVNGRPINGKKYLLRFQKDMDTCGHGLRNDLTGKGNWTGLDSFYKN